VTSIERAAFRAGFLAAVLWGKARARLRSLRPSRRGCPDCARWKSALEDARRPLPLADRLPTEPALPEDPEERELAEQERAERERERDALDQLRMWRAGVSPGRLECGTRLAERLRLALPEVADSDIARVLVRVGWYADFVAEEQDGDAADAWTVLLDSLAVAAPDLAAMELELTEGRGR
jgi:hypothetical protein